MGRTVTKESIYGYIFSGVVTFIFTLVLKHLEAKARLVYWTPNNFLFNVPRQTLDNPAPQEQLGDAVALAPQTFNIQTNTLTIQNLGRKAAEKVEIIHQRRPDQFQFAHGIVYEEADIAQGRHVIKIDSLGPKEALTLQLLSYINLPVLLSVRSKEGPANNIPVKVIRAYPEWLYFVIRAILFAGTFSIIYWLYRVIVFALRGADIM
jgi:hypothetical protein